MITLGTIFVAVGIIWVVLEHGARMASVAPSMYRTSGNGWLLVILGAVIAACGKLP
jgi:hypothetical protein